MLQFIVITIFLFIISILFMSIGKSYHKFEKNKLSDKRENNKPNTEESGNTKKKTYI